MPPLTLDLDELSVELHAGRRATGTGRARVLTHSGPTFDIQDGVLDADEGSLKAAIGMTGDTSPPGVLSESPSHRIRGRAANILIEGQTLTARGPRWTLAEQPTVTGTYHAKLATLTRTESLGEPVRTDVYYLGRAAGHFPLPRMKVAVAGLALGQAVHHDAHTFVLGSKAPREVVDAAATQAGVFSYVGPHRVGDEGFYPLVYRFAQLLGSALGSPVDPVGFVEVSPEREWSRAEWWRPWKPYQGSRFTYPVGSPPAEASGRDRSFAAASDIATWIEAGMRTEAARAAARQHEFDLLPTYLETAASQPRSEMRCRNLVIFIEGMVGAMCAREGITGSWKLGNTLRALRNKARGPALLPEEVKALDAFRNRLSHRGDLRSARIFDLPETQEMFQSEGWLTTVCYRLLASVLGVDLPVADMGDIGFVRSKPSEGGFKMPTFVPDES